MPMLTPGTGPVTSVGSGTGLTGGPVTNSGSLSLATIADKGVMANISGATAAPSANTLTAIIDSVFGTTRGTLLTRGASVWALLNPGTAGYVLTSGGSGADLSYVAAAGGLTDFTDAKNTAAPNATVPVVSLTATGAETNIDAVFTAKGAGALLARVPDGTGAGGNKRGLNAVDLQIDVTNTDATQISSGDYSCIPGGSGNTASGYGALACNTFSVASGIQSSAFSQGIASASYTLAGAYGTADALYGISWGPGNTVDGQFSVILGGRDAKTRGIHAINALSSGSLNSVLGQQYATYAPQGRTTGATATRACIHFSDSATPAAYNQITLIATSAITFEGRLIAHEPATGDTKSWKFEGGIKQGANAAATALVAAVTPSVIAGDSGADAWALGITADTTIGCLAITVTGEASKTINWVCKVDTVETVGA